jgi:hypothetical protein
MVSRTRDIIAMAESAPAATSWSTRLPVVGSMYMEPRLIDCHEQATEYDGFVSYSKNGLK